MFRILTAILPLMMIAPTTAEIIFDGSPGTDAPPATLGPYTMTPFPEDPRPLFEDVTDLPSPLGGSILFDIPMSHRRIGEGWATWSHDYTGDVYYSNAAVSIRMTMPADTAAFYFYVEPGPFSWQTFTATTDDGTTSGAVEVHGYHGAAYFGFYGTDLDTITYVDIDASWDFSVGEFGIAVPEPTTLSLLVLAALAAVRRPR